MIATKEQELKALEKIRKIVEDLGEQSYVRTAFAGCFDYAEQNIEYDAAFSLQEELEISRKESKEKDDHIEQLSSECTALRNKLNETEKHLISSNSLDIAMEAIRKVKGDYFEEVIKLKNTIVENAETPDKLLCYFYR